jgi:XTP/dITP diphosphohydrolase
MLPEIFVATQNTAKFEEISAILRPFCKLISSPFSTNNILEIEEQGDTFEENAFIKASTYFKQTKIPTIADDSGLVIPAFDNKPGLHSRRMYPGTKEEKCTNLLADLKKHHISQPHAYFVCVICLVAGESRPIYFAGKLHGKIHYQAKGHWGFGYDPIFFLPQKGKTLGEIPPAEKRRISHRSLALNKLKKLSHLKRKLLKNLISKQ